MGGWRRLVRLAQVRSRSKLRLPPPEVSPREVEVDGGLVAAVGLEPVRETCGSRKGKSGYNNDQTLAAKFKFA